MSLILNIAITGMVSPSKKPKGFRGSMWSHITLIMAMSGMDKNMPGTPHNAPPASTTTMETNALILTFDATILGTIDRKSVV